MAVLEDVRIIRGRNAHRVVLKVKTSLIDSREPVRQVATWLKNRNLTRIRAGRDPSGRRYRALSEATLETRRRKGIAGTRPLIATGGMLRSVGLTVVRRGKTVTAEIKARDGLELAKMSSHHFGRPSSVPRRRMFGISNRDRQQIDRMLTRNFQRQLDRITRGRI